jgi:hypothetical protein
MKKLLKLLPAISLVAAMLALYPVSAAAKGGSENKPEMVGSIEGRGAANMMDMVAAGLKGGSCDPVSAAARRCTGSTFSINVKLFSDHSARGKFDCVDIAGDPVGYPGDVFGDVSSWSQTAEGGPVTLYITDGTLVAIPGGDPFPTAKGLSFSVTIQQFGGAGVGHWTLDVPGAGNASPFNGGPICQELLSRGRIVGKGEIFGQRHDE